MIPDPSPTLRVLNPPITPHEAVVAAQIALSAIVIFGVGLVILITWLTFMLTRD